jgi:N-acetylmuramoyl-L-alanine amidase
MSKVYLSPAVHQHDNPCAFSSSCGENIHCRQYLNIVKQILDASGVITMITPEGKTMDEAIALSNQFNPDLHFVTHTNAGGGSYRLMMYYSTGGGENYARTIAAACGGVSPNIKFQNNNGLGEICRTKAVAVYDEIVFHDNVNMVTDFHNRMQEYALETARGICNVFNIAMVNPFAKVCKPIDTSKFYRVQVGAFHDPNNAQRLCDELKGKGYSAYVTE